MPKPTMTIHLAAFKIQCNGGSHRGTSSVLAAYRKLHYSGSLLHDKSSVPTAEGDDYEYAALRSSVLRSPMAS